MAGETRRGKRTEHPNSASEVVRAEFNKLVDDVEALRAHVVAETAATIEAGDLTAGKVEGT